MSIKRRFIAGAKCPKCTSNDSIVMLTTHEDERIECVECEYTEKRPEKVEPVQTIESNMISVVQFIPHKTHST